MTHPNALPRASVLLLLLLLPPAAAGCGSFLVNRSAFHPEPVDAAVPPIETETVSEVSLTAADGTRLQAFFVRGDPAEPVVLFLHGNAGNAYQRLDDAQALAACGANVLLLSYRGYGKSAGSPTEDGVYEDAEAALEYLRGERGLSPSETFILGRSIGSAVAVHVARKKGLAGLILVTPLTSARDVARAHGLGWLAWSLGGAFDSLGKIEDVSCPLLVIHGDEDEVIPLALGRELFDAYPGPKAFRPVSGAGHNDIVPRAGTSYWEWIREFIADPPAASPSPASIP